ncbi:glycosyltransferase family 22 protein [Coniophora puteana RWD-64-598 SS2]|uniref:Mannosyltransferase n=1 Tax=Coniophora puteana (strain RWD-64-598) TaxID=741705 RepID=A0A5M3N6D6_CONPW|nr:glycosyltransferase family 22 protein [Coniophora puteana RWD-64-598 SS2]EIW87002.1 glycosyltransferase family 22 protein [Coniophora puteana RWD-64-598 SS2]
MSTGNTQTLRLRRTEDKPKAPLPARHTGILQDQLRRHTRRPWNPSFSMAVRLLLLIRVAGAMYNNIQDCDEVFNFWEPLHYLDHGEGFQTWEVTPTYSIRSWAYILLHLLPARLALVVGFGKRPSFFGVRIFLAVISTLCEAQLCRAVVSKINERVGRYLFVMLLFSAGMWNASSAFLPSSFAMYTTTLAFSYAVEPSSLKNPRRTMMATLLFATGAIVGWPFALALSLPFVIEELFVLGGDRASPGARSSWLMARWKRLFTAGLTASLIFVPVIAIDSVVYGKWSVVPWNIIRYNVFGGSERGPDLYGTSPWYFYVQNLLLNFNVLIVLALGSLPALGVTYLIDRKRLGFTSPSPDQSSPFTLLGLRLAPFYLWIGILTAQAHKEERFMFPAYTLICFNAAVTLYLVRGWMEVAFIKVTKSPYQASKTFMFSNMTFSVVATSALLSLSRVMALWHYYHAPIMVVSQLQVTELPRLLNDTGLVPPPPPGVPEDELPRIDLSPVKEFNLRLCLGKEWHRFPSHYLVPDGVRVEFIKSEFDGMLPAHFGFGAPDQESSTSWWDRGAARRMPMGLNDLNKEASSYYVSVDDCDYLVDLDFPHSPTQSLHEPRYAIGEGWERVACMPFLDSARSPLLTRTLWMPGEAWQSMNQFGDYCLLKNKALVGEKERLAKVAKSAHKLFADDI